jgi:UDP-N-acetyl-D-mannosaminuronate dehydrogenase
MENPFKNDKIALTNYLTNIYSKIEVDVLDIIELNIKHRKINIH